MDSIWITPAQALADTARGRFKLVFATAKNLEKLGRCATVREAMDTARRATVVTVQPKGDQTGRDKAPVAHPGRGRLRRQRIHRRLHAGS